jgi:hypothetical protein
MGPCFRVCGLRQEHCRVIDRLHMEMHQSLNYRSTDLLVIRKPNVNTLQNFLLLLLAVS